MDKSLYYELKTIKALAEIYNIDTTELIDMELEWQSIILEAEEDIKEREKMRQHIQGRINQIRREIILKDIL
jgi:hypothetical protein